MTAGVETGVVALGVTDVVLEVDVVLMLEVVDVDTVIVEDPSK